MYGTWDRRRLDRNCGRQTAGQEQGVEVAGIVARPPTRHLEAESPIEGQGGSVVGSNFEMTEADAGSVQRFEGIRQDPPREPVSALCRFDPDTQQFRLAGDGSKQCVGDERSLVLGSGTGRFGAARFDDPGRDQRILQDLSKVLARPRRSEADRLQAHDLVEISVPGRANDPANGGGGFAVTHRSRCADPRPGPGGWA